MVLYNSVVYRWTVWTMADWQTSMKCLHPHTCTQRQKELLYHNAEFTRGAKSPWISHRRYSTKLRKFLRPQQPTKLSGFMRESGEFLPLFISLLFTVVDVAVLTFSMLMFKFAVCKGAKHSQIVVNRNRMSDISYPGHPNSSTVTSFYNLTPSAPTNSDPNFLQPWNIYTDMKSTCSNVSLHRIKLHSLSFNVASPVVINVKRAALRSWNKGHGEPFGHKFSHCRHDLWPKKTHLAGVKMRSVSGSRTRRRKMIVRAATCERDAPTRLCMHQFDEQSTSTRFFFWVLVESACVRVCAPMKWVDQRRGGPVLKRLWPLWWSVRPGGAEEVSADPQKRLFSMKKCTQILYKDGAYRARILALPQTHYC